MPVDMHVIEATFARHQQPLYYDGKQSFLHPFFHQGQHLLIEIFVDPAGHLVRFRIPCLLNLYDARYTASFAMKLLELNAGYKLLKFGCDPRDGAVSVSVEVLVPDTPLTEEQVEWAMLFLQEHALTVREQLLSLQRTGIWPVAQDPQFEETVQKLLEETAEDNATQTPRVVEEL